MCGLHRMFRLLPAQYIISLLHGFLIKATMSQQCCTPLKHTHTHTNHNYSTTTNLETPLKGHGNGYISIMESHVKVMEFCF